MRTPEFTAQFKKDFKKIVARGCDTSKLDEVSALLLKGEPLPRKYMDHALSNNWKHYRELHITGDWLLVYKIVGDVIVFTRTGTHSDIFR